MAADDKELSGNMPGAGTPGGNKPDVGIPDGNMPDVGTPGGNMPDGKKSKFSSAVQVIVIFGLISLFGDVIYEGARGSYGSYFKTMGVDIATFSVILGVGEFLAYSLRLFAGAASDKTKKYWWFIYAGYGLLIVVPLLGFTRFLPAMLAFVMLERIGKALRNPSKDTILSHVADSGGGKVGLGFAFGLQEFLDKTGAFLGPMIFTLVFFITRRKGVAEYQLGYKLMIIPFALLMLIVVWAHRKISREKLMEVKDKTAAEPDKLPPVFWTYTAFTFVSVLSFIQLPLIAYHLSVNDIMSESQITLIYSAVMAVDAIFALIIGHIYDRIKTKTGNKKAGLMTLLFIPFATAALPFLTLGGKAQIPLLFVGLLGYGVVLGAHETIMRSAISDITPLRKRGTGYGIFNTAFGVSLLVGDAIFGFIYNTATVKTTLPDGAASISVIAEKLPSVVHNIQILFIAFEVIAVGLLLLMRKQIQVRKDIA